MTVRRSGQHHFCNYFDPPVAAEREALFCALEFGHSADRKAGNPKGIESLSPGLRAASYPGYAMGWDLNPGRVVSPAIPSGLPKYF
jgi:hypothetical protein